MKCPKCETLMTQDYVRGIMLDRCSSCAGILVSKTALSAIDGLNLGEAVESSTPADDPGMNDKPAYCYECDNAMVALTGAGDVQFDWCDGCDRTFFDHGELAQFDAIEHA